MCVHVKELKQIPHQDVGNNFVCMVGFGGDSYLKNYLQCFKKTVYNEDALLRLSASTSLPLHTCLL